MVHNDATPLLGPDLLARLERDGLVTRTFRRLDPQRREAVVVAILEEAADRGPTELRVKEVAAAAGVSVGSLYQYFTDRDGLLAFAVALCGAQLAEQLEAVAPYLVAMPLADGLQAYLDGGVEWSRERAGLLRFFAKGAYGGDRQLAEQLVTPLAVVMIRIVRDMLAAAVDRGEARPDLDLEATARVVNAMVIAAGDSRLLPHLNRYYRLDDEQVTFERSASALVSLVLTGVRP